MGEKQSEPFQFTFNGFLKVAFQGSRVTSDAGLIRRSDVSRDRIADAMGPECGPDGGRLVKHARVRRAVDRRGREAGEDKGAGPGDGFGSLQNGRRNNSGPRGGLRCIKGADPGRPKWKSRIQGPNKYSEEAS